MAYLEQLAEWVEENRAVASWSDRLSAFERDLVVVDCSTDPYTVTSAPDRDSPEFLEWWEAAVAECRWLQDNERFSPLGEVNMGWYFQMLGRLVGVEILHQYKHWYL